MEQAMHHHPEKDTDTAQAGKPAQAAAGKSEGCCKRLLNRKMNEELLHYTSRVRCGY